MLWILAILYANDMMVALFIFKFEMLSHKCSYFDDQLVAVDMLLLLSMANCFV